MALGKQTGVDPSSLGRLKQSSQSSSHWQMPVTAALQMVFTNHAVLGAALVAPVALAAIPVDAVRHVCRLSRVGRMRFSNLKVRV